MMFFKNLMTVVFIGSFYLLNAQTSVQFDNLNRLTQYRFNANTVVDYCYDELGNRTCRNVQALVVQQPDLTFINTPTATPSSVSAGGLLCINGAENNTGQGVAGAHNIKYYLSSNTTLDGNDVLLGSTSVNSIAAGGSFAINNVCFNIPAGTASGTWYILVVADADGSIIETNENNNTSVIQITVVNCSSLQASVSVTNTSCGLNNGAITSTVSGGQSPYTRLWSNGSTATNISNLAAGNYFVTITDAQGCSLVRSGTVNNSAGVSISLSSTNTSCQSNTGSATVSVTSGTPNYTYTWSNNATTATINNLAAGNYAVTVRDANNCSATGSVAVNVTAPSSTPVFSASLITQAGTLSVCEGQSLTLNMANGFSNYYWSNGVSAQQQTITFNSPGSQIITGSASNCAGNYYDTVFVTVNALPSATITPATASICSGQSITLSATGGTAYAWSNGATTAATNVSPSVTTGYTVTVTGAGGCTATETRTVTVNGVPTVSISPVTATITVGQSITLTASGGSTYSWSNGGNTAAINVSPTATTTYTVTATNAAGCTAVASRLVTVNPVNSVFIKPDNVQVNGNAVVFTYSTLGTVANLNSSFISIIGEATGFKTGTLTQQGNILTFNCNSPINPGELLHIIIKKGMRNTAGDSLAAFNKILYAPAAATSCGLFDTVSAGVKFPSTAYSYSINTADFDKNGTQDIVCHYFNSYGASTNLVVLLRNANGTFQSPITYTNSQSHSAIIGTPDLNNDGFPDIVVNHNVPSSVAVWLNNGNGTFPASPSLYSVSNFSNGARILDIDNDGFLDIVSYSGVSSLSQNRVSVLRNNGNGTFAAQVAYSTNSGFGSQLQPIDINNDGWIDLAYTSNTAFNSQPTFQLFQNNLSGQVTNILNQSNPLVWHVNGVADFNDDGNEDLLVGRTSAGAIWWGDGNAGFNANTSLNSLTEQFTSIGDIDGDGRYDLVVKHQWTNPTGQNPYTVHRNLGNGNFSTITGNRGFAKFGTPKTQDLNGDGSLDYFYVGNNDSIYIALNRAKPVVAAIASTNPVCGGQNVTLSATAGFSSYSWSNGASSNSFQTATGGLYTVTVTDAVGCTNSASVTLNTLTAPTASISPATATICNGQSVALTASGGTSYTWSNGLGTGSVKSVLPSTNTTYTVTVTGANGCTSTATASITVNTNPPASITPATVAICNGESITLTGSGGTSYAWSNGGGNSAQATFSPTTNTTYTVTVTGTNGCTATASRLVSVNANPTASITPATVAICNGQSAVLTASGGGTYAWSNGGGSNAQASFSPTANTTYTVTVTNANNCTATASRLVTVNALPNAAINGPTSICSGLQATLTASGGDTYLWSNGLGTNASVTVIPLQTTAYTVTVTNSNNCSATATQTVSVQSSPSASISGPPTVCAGSAITLTANGGNTYTWANGLGSNPSITVSPTSNTTYTVTVSVGSNCTATATKSITISQPSSSVLNRTVCQGGSFNFNGNVLTQPGIYRDTITNAAGCDSIITLDLSIAPALQGSFSRTICNGSSFLFDGQNLTQSGTYTTTVQTSGGCDSVITLNLNVLSRIESTVNVGICIGQSYSFNGKQITQAGLYFDTLQTALGCDSFITLNLSVGTFASTILNKSICQGQSFIFNGVALTQPGIYYDTLTANVGCDSIVTLNLTVLQPSYNSITAVICNNNPYNFNGNSITTPGTYTFTLVAANGCDSIVTLTLNNLTTAPTTATLTTSSTSICPNQLVSATVSVQNNTGNVVYEWRLNGNIVFNPSNVFATTSLQNNDSLRVVVITQDGCGNSVLVSSNTLTFSTQSQLPKPQLAVSDSVLCLGESALISTIQTYNSYDWSTGANTPTITVNTAGPFSVQVSNACSSSGSDPVLLKVSSLQQPSVLQSGSDSLYSSVSATKYQWYFNNTFVFGATQPSIIATQNGNYAIEVTDSLGCSLRSVDYNFTKTGLTEITDLRLQIYPNPTSAFITVETNRLVDVIEVYNVIGSIVASIQNPAQKQDIDFSLFASGIYNVVIRKDGNLQNRKVIKE